MTSQRKKFVVVASTIPCITVPAIALTDHLHGVLLHGFAIGYGIAMLALAGYVVSQLFHMKRGAR
jgi:hypothetical protein